MPCDRVANAVVKEPEPSKVAGGVHALREQRVDLGVLEREVAGDADAVRDRVLIVKECVGWQVCKCAWWITGCPQSGTVNRPTRRRPHA